MTLGLTWIRRDLRLHDHHALSLSLKECEETHLVFIFDPSILDKLTNKSDRRLTFIMQSLKEMEETLQKKGASLHICFGDPVQEIPKLAQKLKANCVYTNKDYEPYAKKRDDLVAKKLKAININFRSFKDHVFYENPEVLSKTGGIFKVFTPYKNKWIETFESNDSFIADYDCPLKKLAKWENPQSILSQDWYTVLGFKETLPSLNGGTSFALKRLKKFANSIHKYHEQRDFPALDGTSNLSPYIRHGNLSIRDMIRLAVEDKTSGSRIWLSEIIWRDFYHMVLDTHPYVEKESFKREYDQIKWLGTEEHFQAWCNGTTGFPIIDATMRCFKATGMMHNRLRMIVASFLCKTLLVDWRKGEKYFAENLLDFDLAANSGGWQWSSSSGCDAQPYFRIFNPYLQSEKFDKDGVFIKEWCPELKDLHGDDLHHGEFPPLLGHGYPTKIVSYEKNRQTCLKMYSVVKKD